MRGLIVGIVGITAVALSSTAAAAGCEKPRNAFDSVYCEANLFSQSDRDLNQAFGDLKKTLKPDQQAALKKGQVSWIKQRDEACSLSKEDGYYVNLDCAVEKTTERTAFLKERQRECLSTGCVDSKLAE